MKRITQVFQNTGGSTSAEENNSIRLLKKHEAEGSQNACTSEILCTLVAIQMQTPFQLYDQFKISIIQDNVEDVVKNLGDMLSDLSLNKIPLPIVDFKKVCPTKDIPYNSSEIKFIVYEPSTNPGVTVFFPNFVDGWYTAVYNYTRLKNKNAFQVGFTVDEAKRHPAYFFSYFFIEQGHIKERTVHAIKENKWVFFSDGKPLSFEETDHYQQKRIKDRINNEIIIGYLKSAGYDMTNLNFFSSNKDPILFSN